MSAPDDILLVTERDGPRTCPNRFAVNARRVHAGGLSSVQDHDE
jgi:hypothetical protein